MAFTDADLTAIETAIKSGTLSVQFKDRRVQYRSIAELLDAYSFIKGEIAAAEAAAEGGSSLYSLADFRP